MNACRTKAIRTLPSHHRAPTQPQIRAEAPRGGHCWDRATASPLTRVSQLGGARRTSDAQEWVGSAQACDIRPDAVTYGQGRRIDAPQSEGTATPPSSRSTDGECVPPFWV
jgi:hypothetical protein